MSYTLILHVAGEDPIVGEVDEMPGAGDIMILLNNPRRRDGKDIHYLDSNVVQAMWPVNRINFIEVLPGEQEEQIIGFVRD